MREDGSWSRPTSLKKRRRRTIVSSCVDPNKTNELNVEEFHTDTTSSALTDLTDDQVSSHS